MEILQFFCLFMIGLAGLLIEMDLLKVDKTTKKYALDVTHIAWALVFCWLLQNTGVGQSIVLYIQSFFFF